MTERTALINDLRVAAKRKGLVIDDLFQEFDKGKTGSIPYAGFHRILTTIGFWCPEDRLTSATQPYVVNNKEFLYRDFLNANSSEAASSAVPDATDSLATFAVDLEARGIELTDVFLQYDVHRCGRVSASNFLRTLGPTPLNKSIANQFSHPSTHEIDYLQLNQQVKRLVQTKVKPLTPTVIKGEIPSCLSQLAQQIRERQIDCRSMLTALDRRKKHRISRRQFLQELTQWRLKITAAERDQVANAFLDANGDIDYELFSDEVEAAINSAPPSSAAKSPVVVRPDIKKMIEFLRKTTLNRHSQIEASFQSLDPQKTGFVPAGRFARCLTAQLYRMTPDDVSVLNEEFGDGKGNIAYGRFLAEILPHGARPGPEVSDVLARLSHFLNERKIAIRPILERYQPLTVNDLAAVLRKLSFDLNPQEQAILRTTFRTHDIDVAGLCEPIDYKPPKPVEPEAEPEAIAREVPPESILSILTKLVAAERRTKFDFLSEFRERDSFKNGQMPVSQFQAIVLASGAGVTKPELEVLIGRYRISPQKVDYGSLIIDKDKLTFGEPLDAEPTQTVDELLAQFKIALQDRNIPPQDLFVKYDRFRNGTVLSVRVRSIFDSVGVKLTENDDKLLREAFKDSQSADMFDYGKLCAVITPDEKPTQDRELLLILNSLRDRIQARRRKIREAFPNSLAETISEQAFRNAIATFGLAIREPEIQRLLKYYRVNRQKDVDWQRFVTDVENIRISN